MKKIKGCLYQIAFETSEGTYTSLGGGKDGTLNRSVSTIETTTRDSEGWKEVEVGIKEWSFEMDGLMCMNDACYKELERRFMNDEKVDIKIITPTGQQYRGRAVLTSFPLGMPYSDAATYNISLTGDGKLEDISTQSINVEVAE